MAGLWSPCPAFEGRGVVIKAWPQGREGRPLHSAYSACTAAVGGSNAKLQSASGFHASWSSCRTLSPPADSASWGRSRQRLTYPFWEHPHVVLLPSCLGGGGASAGRVSSTTFRRTHWVLRQRLCHGSKPAPFWTVRQRLCHCHGTKAAPFWERSFRQRLEICQGALSANGWTIIAAPLALGVSQACFL